MATITYLTKIQLDFGAVRLLPEEFAALGVRRPLIVTDNGLVACGLLDQVRGVLPAEMAVAVFDGTPENPTEAAILEALARYREADCDGVIGLGGGSSMDLAKDVRLLASHEAPLSQYALIEGGLARIGAEMPPLAAVPTAAGTGSEVGRGFVVVPAGGRKLAVVSPHVLPSVAICDPELTLGLPPRLTAATGLDAMANCIETFLAPAVHAMARPLGAIRQLNLHHGTLNAVVMPAVLRFNAGHVGDKFEQLGAAMGLGSGAEVIGAVEALNRRLGIPAGLSEMGVEEAWLPGLAEQEVKDHCNATNPRPAGVEDHIAMLREAMGRTSTGPPVSLRPASW